MLKSTPTPPDYGRFAIFVDGSNFYHTVRDLNLFVDYRRLLDFFRTQGRLIRAYYYTLLLESGQAPDWLIRLTDWLAYNGYIVTTKPAKLFRRPVQDEYGQWQWIEEVKGDFRVELAVEMLTLAPFCDTIFLLSGDGDYSKLVKAVQQQGCRVVVVSSERTSENTVADDLRRQADEFLDIATIADSICRIEQRLPEQRYAEQRYVEQRLTDNSDT